MKRQNCWKMAVSVFTLSTALFLIGGGITVYANDQGPKDNNLFVYANTVLGGGPSTIGIPYTLTNRCKMP